MDEQKKKNRFIYTVIVVMVSLLLLNAYLLYNTFNQEKKIDIQQNELEERERIRTELEKQYYEALGDLEEMRGNNDQLNEIIEVQKADLKRRKEEISLLIGEKRDLAKAREKIAELKTQLEKYLQENERLRNKNQLLTQENQTLSLNNERLSTDLAAERLSASELAAQKAALDNQKSELETENYRLSQTVNYASVVRVKDIEVEGYKVKGSGKPVRRRSAKSVEQLNICFTTTKNEIAKTGTEEFFVRIINPIGETMAIESLGSGIMQSVEGQEQLRYTSVKAYDYANDENRVCFTWRPNVNFAKGDYQVEVYNKGYIAGKGDFMLK